MKFSIWSLVSTLGPYQPSSFAVGLDMGVLLANPYFQKINTLYEKSSIEVEGKIFI
jgi:hypothetical protein